MRALELPSHPRDGVLPVSLEAALGPARGRPRIAAAVLTPSYANPLGSFMPDAARREVVELLARRGVPLIEDDIYGDIAFDGSRPRPAKAHDAAGGVLLCSSFSKSLAPGLRVGWCAPGRYRDAVAARKLTSTIASATLPQLAIADLMESGAYDRHLRRLRAALRDQTAAVAAAVARRFPEGTRVSRPGGGLVLWVELPRGVDALCLYRRAREARIGIAPGPLFSASGRYRSFIRLSCGSPFGERVERALATLGRMAGEMARPRV
jgi:DNA-binding transcriptional MocR family regulator